MTVPHRGGPPRLYDTETGRRRRNEQTYRERLIDREMARWLKTHHRKIYDKARSLVENKVNAERGPLPGSKKGTQ